MKKWYYTIRFQQNIQIFQKTVFYVYIYVKFNVDTSKTVGFPRSLCVLKLLLFFWQEFSENLPKNAHSNGFDLAFWATFGLKIAGIG